MIENSASWLKKNQKMIMRSAWGILLLLGLVVAVAVPATVILANLYGSSKIPAALKRRFSTPAMEDALGKVPAWVIFNLRLLAKVIFLQAIIFLLDSATLWAMLLAATLLLRGLTLWLPMLPRMWLARQELSRNFDPF